MNPGPVVIDGAADEVDDTESAHVRLPVRGSSRLGINQTSKAWEHVWSASYGVYSPNGGVPGSISQHRTRAETAGITNRIGRHTDLLAGSPWARPALLHAVHAMQAFFLFLFPLYSFLYLLGVVGGEMEKK